MPVIGTLLAGAVTLLGGDRIDLRDDRLRVGDVVRLDALPTAMRPAVAGRIVARLPGGGMTTLSRAALARLVRRTVPGLEVAGGGADMVTIVHPRTRVPAGTSCRTLDRSIEAGEAIRPEMLVPSVCVARVPTSVDFDRATGIVRARRRLAPGTALGRLALPAPAAVQAGETLLLTSISGAVRIARPVTAFQSGRAGGRVFVRAGDGAAFAVPLGARP